MAKVCQGKLQNKTSKTDVDAGNKDGQRSHFVEESVDEDDAYTMYHLSGDQKKAVKVDVKFCGKH